MFSDQEIVSYRLLADSHITPSLVAGDIETPLLVTEYVKGVGLFAAFDRLDELGVLMASLIASTYRPVRAAAVQHTTSSNAPGVQMTSTSFWAIPASRQHSKAPARSLVVMIWL